MALNLPPASESRFLPSPLLVWGKVELINEREAYFAQWKATAGSEARKPNPQSRDVVLLRATIVARSPLALASHAHTRFSPSICLHRPRCHIIDHFPLTSPRKSGLYLCWEGLLLYIGPIKLFWYVSLSSFSL